MKDSFLVQYVVHLWIASIGITGPFGAFVAFIASRILGDMADRGIILIDISIDKWGEAIKDQKWREAAIKAYRKASAKVYTEGEKDAIRKEYMDALSAYAAFGNNKLPDNQNP